jgi:hypothetical protein
MTHEQRQRSDVIAGLRRDSAQHASDLMDAMKATNAMASAAAKAFDELGAEIVHLRERLVAAETRCEQVEKQDRERQTASAAREREMAITLANLRSEVADLRVELRTAVVVGTVPATSSREVN